MQSSANPGLEAELEALRRELSQPPILEETDSGGEAEDQSAGARSDIEKTLRDLQERLGDATDEAEELIAAHPFASVAAAFLLGVLVANFLSRGK